MLALGVDVGTSTTKAALVLLDGDRVRELAVASAPTPGTGPELVATALRTARDAVGDRGRDVVAVGVASMAETGLPLDAGNRPLTPLLRWDEGLGAEDASRMRDLAPDLFVATGVRLSAKTPLATWAWLRRTRPEVWSRTACWLGAADLLVQALTGSRATDHTLAGRTGGARLPGPGEPVRFDDEILGVVGMRPDRLPLVVDPREVAGRLGPDVARDLGLPAGVPVVVAGHDHQVAAWAAGVRRPHQVADSLGTAEAVLTVLPQRPAEPARVRADGMSLVRTVAGDHDAVVAGSSSAGAMLRAWLDTLDPEQQADVLARAAREDAAPTGAAVLPYLRGRQTPAPDPDAVAGAPPAGWPPHRQARAVVEGVCYQARWMITTQTARPGEVTVVAGDRLPLLWTDLKSATLPWPLATVTAAEPVAGGAALLALVRAGALGPAAQALHDAPTLPRAHRPALDSDPHGPAVVDFVARATAGRADLPGADRPSSAGLP